MGDSRERTTRYTRGAILVATLRPGTRVRLAEDASAALRFPPPADIALTVVVHRAALNAPHDAHTQVAAIAHGELVWLGALGEDVLGGVSVPRDLGARAVVAERFLVGSRLWEVVRVGGLLGQAGRGPLSTVYDGSEARPWVVVGETILGELIVVPLNDASRPKWWTPVIAQVHMRFSGNIKDGQAELAHAWTVPAELVVEGEVLVAGRGAVERAIEGYYGTAQG